MCPSPLFPHREVRLWTVRRQASQVDGYGYGDGAPPWDDVPGDAGDGTPSHDASWDASPRHAGDGPAPWRGTPYDDDAHATTVSPEIHYLLLVAHSVLYSLLVY